MKRTDNQGYTLIELIVAFALLAIVSAIMLGFVSSGGKMYNSVSAEVSLQMSTQIALAQLKEYIIDCNEGLCFEPAPGGAGALYILNSEEASDGSKTYTLHTFRFTPEDKSLYYGNSPVTLGPSGDVVYTTDAPDLMADDLSTFSVDFSNVAGSTAWAVELTADFSSRSKTYNVSQTVSLRNRPHFSSGSLSLLMPLIF